MILSAWAISFITIFNLSSNCPRYLVPAIKAPRSKEIIFLPMRVSGISPETIFWQRPSTIAVLPTPGSPIITGLFLILLPKTCNTLSISSSLPITGSRRFSLAIKVRSRPNSSRAGVALRFSRVWTNDFIERLIVSCLAPRRFAPRFRNIFPAIPSSSRISPRRRCSLPI
jgi:hypothetical protein